MRCSENINFLRMENDKSLFAIRYPLVGEILLVLAPICLGPEVLG